MNPSILFSLLFLACFSCTPASTNTLVSYGTPKESEEATVIIPANMEIVSLKYDAELYTTITKGDSMFEGTKGRGFVVAHARHLKTGIHYLLIYENPRLHKYPKQIIRFQPEAEQ